MKKSSLMFLFATILVFTACDGDKDEPKGSSLTKTDYTLYAGETTELEGLGLKNLTWMGDNFVAEVDNQGVLHGNKVGYTSIVSDGITSGTSGLFAIVKPKNTSFSEPLLYRESAGDRLQYKDGYLQFDPKRLARMPKSDIWGMNSVFLNTYIKECGLPWTVSDKTATTIVYKTDKVASPYVAYILNDEGNIIGAGVYIDPFKSIGLPDFLNERYTIYDVDMSTYTANFAHAITSASSNELSIDYVGQMRLSTSINMLIVMYMQSPAKGNTITDDITNELSNIKINN